MPVYVSFLGHVELPRVDDRPPRQIPETRVDRRPALRRRKHSKEA
jgi:hypothetical protein